MDGTVGWLALELKKIRALSQDTNLPKKLYSTRSFMWQNHNPQEKVYINKVQNIKTTN